MKIRLIAAVVLSIVTTCTTVWSAPVTTYVAEFKVSGSDKPEEMKTTLQSLLLSRLASQEIATVNKQSEGSEIVVSGSYLLSGSVFSLDAVAVNRSGGVVARAYVQGKSPDELIPAVGVLAKSLSEGIDRAVSSIVASKASPLPPDIIKPVGTATAKEQVVLNLAGALNGLAIGRTFPGGDRELFVVGDHTLRYYLQGAELKLLAEISYKTYEKILAVDTADLGGKIPEIYLTIMKGETLVSQVWTVDGTGLKQIAGPLPYFFRAVTSTAGVKRLYAQQMTGRADFDGDVSEVVKAAEGYVLKNPVKLPKQGYLYNFNILKGLKGELDPIIVDRSGHLRVFNQAGVELWKSSEEYGGSETNFERLADEPHENGSGYRKVFLDKRIVMMGNGELLVPRNLEPWYDTNKHSYSRSSLYCFAVNGESLEEKWHSKQDDHYLADFAYEDSSHELLLLEVVSKGEGLLSEGASRLVVRKIDQSGKF